MWALRRASVSIRKQGLNKRNAQLCFATSELSNYCFEECDPGVNRTAMVVSDRSLSARLFYKMGSCSFSSHAGTKSSGEEDGELDGFSELRSPLTFGSIQENKLNNDDGLVSESESLDDDAEGLQREVGLSDTETHMSQTKTNASSELLEVVLASSSSSVSRAMDKWVEDGKELTLLDIIMVMRALRKMRVYGKALKMSEWLKSSKHFDLTLRYYVSHVDLIAKVSGIQKAEAYVQNIPECFRSEEAVYRVLLANCVYAWDVKKSEEVFNKMKDLNIPISIFTFNKLLHLYKRTDKKKMANVLLLLEKENVKPDLFTYKMLIDSKSQYNDITGIERVVETMKADGLEPDISTKSLLARIYTRYGLNEKAEVVLKEMEGDDVAGNSWAYTILLPLYASLVKTDEVRRIWKLCESNPRLEQCLAAIEAWGKLKEVDEAEAVFEIMQKKYPKIPSRCYAALLNAYANNKMLAKGEDLVKKMTENGCHIGLLTWRSLIKLYIESGEVEKADSILAKASKNMAVKPLFRSYTDIIKQYAKKGDVHNSEKIFHKMREAGFTPHFWLYQILVSAYCNARVPAYGMQERMKGDNVFPKKSLGFHVDPFQDTEVSHLLE